MERSTLSLAEWLDHQGSPGDELIECIGHVARHFDRSPGIVALRAGLAVDESGRLPFHQAESALDQIGLLSDLVRGRLDKWRPANLPAILPLRGERFLVLLNIKQCDALVQLPHASEPCTVQGAADIGWLCAGSWFTFKIVS